MDFPLPAGFPTAASFPPAKIITVPQQTWSFHRGPGSGGGNAGENLNAPAGTVVVGIDFGVTSDHGAGAFDNHIVMEQTGVFNLPIGFHTGARLEPGSGFGGAGATYAGGVTLQTVSQADWFAVAAHT
jgi:hypothetical protein